MLNMWIIKFYKAIIRVKDEIYGMYLTRKGLLKHIIEIFIENNNKDNMIHSVVLELFDYLAKEPNKKIN